MGLIGKKFFNARVLPVSSVRPDNSVLAEQFQLFALCSNRIASALVFIDVSPYWIRAVQGVLILLTVVADILRRRRMARGQSR